METDAHRRERPRRSGVLEDFAAARAARGIEPPATVPQPLDAPRSSVFFLALSATVGAIMVVSGGALWVAAFDRTFLVSDSSEWEFVGGIGALLLGVGAVLIGISLVGGPLVAGRGLVRRAVRTRR